MKELYLATANEKKLREAKNILKTPIKIARIEIDEVQSMDLIYVAHQKAKTAFEKVGNPIIVDDVALYIEALNELPGPFVKFFLKALGNEGLLKLLENETNRNVIVRSAIGYHDGNRIHVFVGDVKGTLSKKERGKDGWGFDPIIIPEGYTKTFAELGSTVKNKISHRRRAFDLLKYHLDSQK